LRAINERTVLELIQHGGATSRAQIARKSGLSKPTVSLALGSLVEAGLVHEVGRATGGKGPSAVLYELNPGAGWVVGIDVGAHWLRAAAADITGAIVARVDQRARSRSAGQLVQQIGHVAQEVASEAGLRWSQVTHATVGSSGVLDPSRGLLAHAPNLPGWGRQGLVGAIRDELGTAVSFENDVNLAALGERSHGAGRNVENFVFLWVGTGVGMGIVINGELYRGAGGAAGEIGYMPVGEGNPSDPRFRRRGMLEEWAGASAVTRAARASALRQPAKGIFAAARRGDRAAAAVVEDEAGRIAVAIAAVAPVIDPQLVIMGGGIGGNPDLRPAVERRLSAISPFTPRLATSELGEDAVLRGAVVTALEAAREQLFTRKPLSRSAVV
jgi:predicted NBD/HSP70 family sugar kinase